MDEFNVFMMCEDFPEEAASGSREKVTDIIEYELESGVLTFPENIIRNSPKLLKNLENVREIRFSPKSLVGNLDTMSFSMFINLEKINIQKNVKNISVQSFKGCKKLNSITFDAQSQLEKVCNSAFYECESLEHIDLPHSLQTIEKFSFSKSGLIHLDLSRCQCKTIGDGSFQDCLFLETVVMPSCIEKISKSLFENCKQLSSVEFQGNDSLLFIEERAFFACSSLSNIKIPLSTKSIYNHAFSQSGLIEIKFNDSLISIGRECFAKCRSLQTVHVSKKLKILVYKAFSSCTSLSMVIFEEDSELEKIDSLCFNNTSIETISLPASLKKIEYAAFKQTKLKQVNFAKDSKLEIIKNAAFESGIDKVVLPPNLKYVMKNSFDQSTHLDFSKCKYLVKSSSNVIFNRGMKRIVSIPASLKHFIIPESVTMLDMGLFSGTQIEWINIPSSVEKIIQSNDIPRGSIKRITFSKDSKLKNIGQNVFRSLQLSRISIPSSVEKINLAFQNNFFERIHFQERSKLKELRTSLFFHCNIIRIDIPSSVEIIRKNAFDYTNIEIIKFHSDSKMKKINYHAFNRIKSINLENCKQLEMIEYKAFDKEVFESLVIKPFVPMKIDEDGQLIHYDHDATYVVIPDDVVSFGPKIFCNMEIEKIKFNERSSLKIIGKYSFSLIIFNTCIIELRSIVFPPNLELIEEYAFYGCQSLQKNSFMEGSKLKRIKNYAFKCGESLRCVELPDHEIVIGKYAFDFSADLKAQNIIWEEIEDDDDQYEEEDGEDLEFDSPVIVIPASVEKILSISNKQKTVKITYEEGSKLKEIKHMYLNEGMIDVFLPPSVEKIKYYSFHKLKSLNIMNNNFKTSDERIVTSFYPCAILFVPPNIESIDIDPELEIIFSFAFYKSHIKSISLPVTIKIIGEGAFLNSELEKIDFAEGTELDILDSKSLLTRNLKNIKVTKVREITGYSIVTKDFHRIEFPKNFCPKIDRCSNFIEFGRPNHETLWKQKIILPFTSIEFISQVGIAQVLENLKIIYDQ